MAGDVVNVLSEIPSQYHGGIRAGTSSVDVDGWILDAIAKAAAIGAGGTAASGATVYLPPGRYRAATNLLLPANVNLVGAGNSASQLQWTGGAGSVVTIGLRGNVCDLWIRGDATDPLAGVTGIDNTANASSWQMQRLRVVGFETGVNVNRTWINKIEDCTITNNVNGVRVQATDTNINVIRGGNIQANSGAGVLLEGSISTILDGATIQGNGYGVQLAGFVYKLVARDCYFEINSLGHVYQTNTNWARSVSLKSNSFWNASDTKAPVSVYAQAAISWEVEGNHFGEPNTTAVMKFEAACDGVHVKGPNYYVPGYEFVPATHYLGTNFRQTGEAVVTDSLIVGGLAFASGSATPNGTLAAAIGSVYQRTGGTVCPLYVKASGTGDTGWHAIWGHAALTYGAFVGADAAQALVHTVTITDGVAFTVSAPANPIVGRSLTLRFKNASGGAMGDVTFNSVFRSSTGTTWDATDDATPATARPADGYSRSITFVYDGTNWVETGRTPADVVN